MAGFDFGVMAPILGEYFDTDVMDIGRSTLVTLPDGSTSVTDPKVPIYTNVPCHISFDTVDNPDPVSVGSIPIIQALRINCAVGIDLQNADYVTARKLAADGTALEEYTGTIGAPATSQSRQTALMALRQGV